MQKTIHFPEETRAGFTFPAHTITWKQDLAHIKKSFPPHDLEIFLSLYALAQTHPKKAKKEGESFFRKYPTHPKVLNLLTFILLSLKKIRQAQDLIEKNYEYNPDYLFAKINYADQCIQAKKTEKVPEIFDGKFSLKELYPEKKVFHISEFRGFMMMMGFYHLAIGEREKAIFYHEIIYRIDPHHPSTKTLQKKIYFRPFYKRFCAKFVSFLSCV